MPEMYGVEYPELVEDRDGKQMPYNPDVVGKGEGWDLPPHEWMKHFCICGHLIMDHHFDVSLGAALTEAPHKSQMPCWAVGCPCYLQVSKKEIRPVFELPKGHGLKPDKAIVILVRVEDEDNPFPGSVAFMADCGHECWISPALNADLAEMTPGSALSMCMQCAVEDNSVAQHIARNGTAMSKRSAEALEKERGQSLEEISEENGYDIHISELP